VGGHLAVKLHAAGHEVSAIARGPQLAAIRAQGLVLEQAQARTVAKVAASDEAHELGAQDVVFVTTKATSLQAMATQLEPLVEDHTTVVFLQNGMPWWYPVGLPAGRPAPPSLPVFQLADTFLAFLRPEQVLGGVVYSGNEVVSPGVVRNTSAARNAIELGSIDPASGARVLQVRQLLEAAGFRSPAASDIRACVWLKLLLNAAGSAIAVATGSPTAIADDADVREVFRRVVQECARVAAANGYDVSGQLDTEAWTRSRHKASMLQDFDLGRRMEVDEILLSPVAFARAASVSTPTLDAVVAIAARRAADKGLFTPKV